MLLSMTGFGTATVTLPNLKGRSCSLIIEVKSYNLRFFESSCKLPSALWYSEHAISSFLKKKLVRGRVYLNISSSGGVLERIVPSFAVAHDYLTVAQEIKQQCNIVNDLTVSTMLALPNVLSFEQETITQEQENIIFKGIEQAVAKLLECRLHEGEEIQIDLQKRFALCRDHIVCIESNARQLIEEKKQLLQKTLALAENGDEQSKIRLDELYKSLDKIDVHEEISRFKGHLGSVKQIFAKEEQENGRRLDFVLQELTREINTIMAKCSSYEIGSIAIDIKVELEKAREQTQNVV